VSVPLSPAASLGLYAEITANDPALLNKLSSALRTVFDGIAKPIPSEPPLRETIVR